MGCLALNLPSVRKNLRDLTKMFGNKDIAYAVLESNNGYPLDYTREGEPSILYKTIESVVQDTTKTHLLKARIHSPEFIKEFGDWRYIDLAKEYSGVKQDRNLEPVLFKDYNADFFVGKSGKIPLMDYQDIVLASKVPVPNVDVESYEKALRKQYTKEPDGPIKAGSVVLYSQDQVDGKKIESTDNKVTVYYVYKSYVEGGVPMVDLVDPRVIKGGISKLTRVPTSRLKKEGKREIIKGDDIDSPPAFITNDAKIIIIKSTGVSLADETFEDSAEYLTKAYEAGKNNIPATVVTKTSPNSSFDSQLAQKIQDKLQKLYPEIKLNITNTPAWEYGDNVFNQEEYDKQINYRLKATEILLSDKAKQIFSKGEKAKWDLNKILTELSVPKEQKQLLLDLGITDREQLALELASKYSYSVEINTAKSEQTPAYYNEDTGILEGGMYERNSEYYSNLTVPGGTNYTENEISTPLIVPSIKGHAEFSTDNGIGWFRSDEKFIPNNTHKHNPLYTYYNFTKDDSVYPTQYIGGQEVFEYNNKFYVRDRTTNEPLGEYATKKEAESYINTYINNLPKTRRILEVQSDLFQKGRDKDDLATDFYTPTTEEDFAKNPKGEEEYITRNSFLQLLNKDNNWVTFFIKSIIQDSAKKGYEKVLFPKGETAAKVEGHETIADSIKRKDAEIDHIKYAIEKGQDEYYYEDHRGNSGYFPANKDLLDKAEKEKQELKSQGIEKLKPIEAFYEIKVGNILEKQFGKDNVKTITDEYGNEWREITINPARDLSNIFLQKNEANQIIGQANTKALTILVDAINQKQDTLPHEYAHHYIAWNRNTPIVQEAIKKWGSEEALVQSIGEQAVKQKGDAWEWWKKFVNWFLGDLNKLSLLDKAALTKILTDAFLTRQDLTELEQKPTIDEDLALTSYSKEDTPFINIMSEGEVAEALAEIDAAITGGVLSFVVKPEKFRTSYDNEVIEKSFVKLGWVSGVKEGVNFYSRPTKKAYQKKSEDNNISLASRVIPPNSLEERVNILLEGMSLNPADHIIYPGNMAEGTAIEKAIIEAVPEAIILNLPSSPVISEFNSRLYDSITTDPSDPRIVQVTGTSDMDLYNKLMYDNYSTSVSRELVKMAPTDELSEEIFLNIKVPNAEKKVKTEIKSLENHIHRERLKGSAEKDLQYFIDRVNEKKQVLKDIKNFKSVTQIKQMADMDKKEVERILNSTLVSSEDILSARKIIDTWAAISDFEDESTNYLLEDVEIQDPTVKALFRDIYIEFETLGKDLNKLGKSVFVNRASENLGKTFTFRDMITLKTRVWNWIYKNFYSIAHLDNPIAAYLMNKINTVNSMATTRAITKSRELGELYKRLKDSKFDVELFWQKGNNDDITGNLVTEYTFKFWNNMRNFHKNKTSVSWLRDNTFIIDPKRAEKDRQDYIDELTPNIGVEMATKKVDEAAALFKEYKSISKDFMIAEFGHTDLNRLTSAELNIYDSWINNNSPVRRHRLFTVDAAPNSKYKNLVGYDADRFIVIVPKKYDSKGKPLNLYDKNYETIKNDPIAFAFYEEAAKIVDDAYNNFNDSSLSRFTLAHVESGMIQEMHQLGIKDFAKDAAINYFTSANNKEKVIDPITGKEVKKVEKSVITLAEAIEVEYKRRRDLLKAQKINLTAKDEAILFTEASNYIMSGDKGDIFMALNSLNLASMTYSYKAAIQPEIDLAMHYLDEMAGLTGRQRMIAELEDEKKKPNPNKFIIEKLELALKNTGNNVKLKDITEQDVQNAKDMINYFVDKEYYDLGGEDRSFRKGRKFYTKKEKEELLLLKQELDVLKSKGGNQSKIDTIETRINSLGRYISVDKMVQSLIDSLRFTALSWNLPSFLANLLQGNVANLIESVRGENFTTSGLKQATGLLFSERGKFDNIVKNYAILGDIMYDFAHKNPFEEKKSSLGNAARFIKPMEGNKFVETVNQGQVMVAMMLHHKVKDVDTGEEISFWDAVDESGKLILKSDGTDKYSFNGKTGDEAITGITLKVRNQLTAIHGDYTNPKLVQKYATGRALILFKTWFFDPFMARFGPKRWDYISQSYKQGRYITTLQAIREFGLNYKTFKAAYDRGEVSAVQLQNLRVTMMELTVGVMTYVLQALVKAEMCNNNSASTLKCRSAAGKFLVSSLRRLDQETRTFWSVKGYLDILNNPTAILKYMQSLNRVVGYAEDVLAGRGMENQQGENKFLNEAIKMTPGAKELFKWAELDEVSRLY
jgi:hypothetical protein